MIPLGVISDISLDRRRRCFPPEILVGGLADGEVSCVTMKVPVKLGIFTTSPKAVSRTTVICVPLIVLPSLEAACSNSATAGATASLDRPVILTRVISMLSTISVLTSPGQGSTSVGLMGSGLLLLIGVFHTAHLEGAEGSQ